MRVTTNMISDTYINALSDNLGRLNDSFTEMSSEKKFTRASDDPADAMKVLSSLHNLSGIAQQQSSITDATSWVNNSESTVNTVNEIVKSVQSTLTAANSSATLSSDDLNTYATQLQTDQSQLLETLNSTFGGRYVFGESADGPAPFRVGTAADDGAANAGKLMIYDYNASTPGYIPFSGITSDNADSKKLTLPVDVGLGLQVGSDGKIVPGTALETQTQGIDLLAYNMTSSGCSNLYDMLGSAVQELQSGTSSDLGTYITQAGDAQSSVLKVTADIGGKSQMLSFLSDRSTTEKTNQQTVLSNLQDVDVAQAATDYTTQQTVYNATLAVGAKILQKTLFDFLS